MIAAAYGWTPAVLYELNDDELMFWKKAAHNKLVKGSY